MKQKDKFEILSEIAKRRGFFWPSYEIYGGVSGFMTFGPLGSLLKRKIEDKFRDLYIRPLAILEIESSVIMPSRVFEASGHIDHFKEPIVQCSKCEKKFRADHLLQESGKMSDTDTEKLSLHELMKELQKNDIRCPECKGSLGDPQQFMTMFSTIIGPYSQAIGYGRPEAAQGIFVEFERIYKNARGKLPLGVVQIGHALRNEISPRQGPIRLREFTIMDVEFFIDPKQPQCSMLNTVKNETLRLVPAMNKLKKNLEPIEVTVQEALEKEYIKAEWQAYFMALAQRFLMELQVPKDKQRFIEKLEWERAHYSEQGFDQEVHLDRWGWVEVSGHNYRTDYDLTRHMTFSGVDLTVYKKTEKDDEGRKFIPHVIEPSFGSDRLVYVALEYAYTTKNNRVLLKLPREIAPIQIGIFPLVSKDGLPEKGKQVYQTLITEGFTVEQDEAGSIGRRYARSDEIGTPLGVTVDYQTLEDNTVTIRDRDSWRQVRNEVPKLPKLFHEYFRYQKEFEDLGASIHN